MILEADSGWLRAHSGLVATDAYKIADALRQTDDKRFNLIIPTVAALIGWSHDFGKYQREKERLSSETKQVLVMPGDIWEFHPETERLNTERLKRHGYPREVTFATTDHDFAQRVNSEGSDYLVANWKTTLVADYQCTTDRVTTTEERYYGPGGVMERYLKTGKFTPLELQTAGEVLTKVTRQVYEVIGEKEELFIADRFPTQPIGPIGFHRFLESHKRDSVYDFFPDTMIKGRKVWRDNDDPLPEFDWNKDRESLTEYVTARVNDGLSVNIGLYNRPDLSEEKSRAEWRDWFNEVTKGKKNFPGVEGMDVDFHDHHQVASFSYHYSRRLHDDDVD